MNARIVARVTIDATMQEVFNRLIDLKTHHLWNPHLQQVIPATKLRAGGRYTTQSRLLGISVDAHITVTKLIRNRELELSNTSGALHYRVVYKLHRQSGNTLLRCITTVTSDSKAFPLTRPLLALLAHHELQVDLRALKRLVESKSTAR